MGKRVEAQKIQAEAGGRAGVRVRRSRGIIDMYEGRGERVCLRAEHWAWRKRALKWARRVLPWAVRKKALPFVRPGGDEQLSTASGVKSLMPTEDVQEAGGSRGWNPGAHMSRKYTCFIQRIVYWAPTMGWHHSRCSGHSRRGKGSPKLT